jgi:hypothetical protein
VFIVVRRAKLLQVDRYPSPTGVAPRVDHGTPDSAGELSQVAKAIYIYIYIYTNVLFDCIVASTKPDRKHLKPTITFLCLNSEQQKTISSALKK